MRVLFSLLAVVVAGQPLHAAEGRPNLVLFLADDLGYGDLGCFGHPVIQTPHLDAFARQGVRLTQCYSASAVCSPSRSALLTGRTPHRNGVFTWIAQGSEVHLRKSEVTLPALLQASGYATCHSGKWHLNGKFNSPDQPQPGDHGYDWWMATQNNAAPSHKNPGNFVRNGKPVGPQEGYSAVLVVEEAISWLGEKRPGDKPFFLAVWTHEPHLPIESDPQYQKPYEKIANADVRQHHGNVTQLDAAFGKLMKALDDQKLTDNTLVLFTSDNGPEGNGNMGRTRGSSGGLRGRKRAMYEGGIRVPGIVRWPGQIKPGTTCDVPLIGSDVMPTFLNVAGVKQPKDRKFDGVDVQAVLKGKDSLERPVPLYWRLNMAPGDMHVAMRVGDWKLLATEDLAKFEMYNLKADPGETTDLKDREKEKFESLRKQLADLHNEIEKEGPEWWRRLTPNGGMPKKKMESPTSLVEPLTHRFIAADRTHGKVGIVNSSGEIEWEFANKHDVHDLHVLPNGNLLIHTSHTKIVEITPEKKVVWEYTSKPAAGNTGAVEVHAFQRLANGATMIAESGNSRIIEVDATGAIVKEVPLSVKKRDAHRDTRLVRKLDSGNYLVCHEAEGMVKEYDPTGKVVWEYTLDLGGRPARPGHGPEGHGTALYSAVRLPNGNTLIGGGNNNRVVEVDSTGKIVWSVDQKELPGITLAWVTTVQVLPNGNVVIGNCHAGPDNPQLIEVTRDKKVVWTFKDFKNFGNNLATAQILDVRTKR